MWLPLPPLYKSALLLPLLLDRTTHCVSSCRRNHQKWSQPFRLLSVKTLAKPALLITVHLASLLNTELQGSGIWIRLDIYVDNVARSNRSWELLVSPSFCKIEPLHIMTKRHGLHLQGSICASTPASTSTSFILSITDITIITRSRSYSPEMPNQPSAYQLNEPADVKDILASQAKDYDCTSCRVMGARMMQLE